MSTKKKPVPLIQSKEFKKFKELLDGAKRVLISTHSLPDGDGLGAEVALFHYLKRARKACRVYNPDALPKRYRFLDPKSQILLGPGQVEMWDTADLWIIVDTNDPRRLGKIWQEMAIRSKRIVFLDHHPETESAEIKYPPNSMVLSDVESSSIGEMLYRLFHHLGLAKLNTDVAQGLYVSVMTDTNSFRYARTTPLAHSIAAETIELGVNPEEIYQNIFSSKELSHLKLLGFMLQNVKVSQQGRVAWLELPLAIRKQYQASADDTQSFMNLLLLLKDAEVICFFREEDDLTVRASVRSKGKVVINKILMELGGGGHEFAAGAALPGPLDKAVSTLMTKIEAQVDRFERFGK